MTLLIKLYMILMAITAFACGITGLSIFFITSLKLKGLFMSISGMYTAWLINEEIIKHETIKEEYEC